MKGSNTQGIEQLSFPNFNFSYFITFWVLYRLEGLYGHYNPPTIISSERECIQYFLFRSVQLLTLVNMGKKIIIISIQRFILRYSKRCYTKRMQYYLNRKTCFLRLYPILICTVHIKKIGILIHSLCVNEHTKHT